MDTNSYIFPVIEIEYSILNYLDQLIDFPKLYLINKYYSDFVINDKLYTALKQFYLMEKIKNKKLTKEENNFVSACTNNNLLVAKYLYQKNKINIHAHNELAFRRTCIYGHLEVTKWLYLLGNETGSPIDIHAGNEYAFRYACYYGHLEIAKWLHLLGNEIGSPINIHACNEFAFRCACSSGHLEIVDWLHSL